MNQKKLYVIFVTNSTSSGRQVFYNVFCKNQNLRVKRLDLWVGQRPNGFIHRVFSKIRLPLDRDRLNERLLQEIRAEKVDFVFLVKGNYIWPKTLKTIKVSFPKVKIVGFSGDNTNKKWNTSRYFEAGLRYYDIFFSINISSYIRTGEFSDRFVYMDKCFCSDFGGLASREIIFKGIDVLFVGSYEQKRYEYMRFLAENGVSVTVYGAMWETLAMRPQLPNLKINAREIVGVEYCNAIRNAKITLGFLRQLNGDTQTSRSFEIPGCGGCALLEDSIDHRRLFADWENVVLFDGRDQLLERVRLLLANSPLRKRIANAGMSLAQEYSCEKRGEDMLEIIWGNKCAD